jgi:diacylglycerol O-acyltransferase / wax synthase
VDAPAFDLADHVRVLPLPNRGDEAALLRAAEQLRRLRLDRSRPLWQVWLLPGLAEGQVGMYVKIHHVIGDDTAVMAASGRCWTRLPMRPPGRRGRGRRPRRRPPATCSPTTCATMPPG